MNADGAASNLDHAKLDSGQNLRRIRSSSPPDRLAKPISVHLRSSVV
jgi:hypothetical protein